METDKNLEQMAEEMVQQVYEDALVEGETYQLSQTVMVNHDLNTLFLIARTLVSREFLNAILYGDFAEVTDNDLQQAREIVNAQRNKEQEQLYSGQLDSPDSGEVSGEGQPEGLWGEEDTNPLRESTNE